METDLQWAHKVSQVANHFPGAWHDYQDWLHEIVASRSLLRQKHPAWFASLIFRWRLLYFVLYVGGIVLGRGVSRRLQAVPRKMSVKPTLVLPRHILQRLATLLAVTELTLCGTAALTGILLAFYYQPAAVGAHESLLEIAQKIPSGALIFSLHHVTGHALIAIALVQIVVMFFGREFLLPWLTGWLSGLFLALAAMGLSWTAIVLSWDQTSFWRFKLELNIVGSLPLIGEPLQAFLSGGNGISSITLQHMYALHSYVLAISALFFSVAHLTALIWQERQADCDPAQLRKTSQSI